MSDYTTITVNRIKRVLNKRLGIDASDSSIYAFWNDYSEKYAASWLNDDGINEFDIINLYKEYIEEIILETSYNIDSILTWSERKEDVYNIPYNIKLDLDSFIKDPCYDNIHVMMPYIEENKDIFLDFLYYIKNNTKNNEVYNILFSSLADVEIQLDQNLAYLLFEFLESESSKVSQSSAFCLISCFGERGRKEVEDAIEYGYPKHKELLKGLLNL